MNLASKLVIGCATSVLLGASAAQAQSAPPGAAADSDQVQDIVVTAQRREERLQDVPIAVTVVNSDQLARLNITSALDLRIAAPALNTTNASNSFVSSIRGVGSFGFAPGAESPVGVYIDGIYIAQPQGSELTLNNIASIEVLKGPQGTLFGRNTTGGAIQIITRTPTETTTADLTLTYGNFQTKTATAYISGGLANNLAADLAFTGVAQGEGWGTNLATGADTHRVYHDDALRSKIVWTPGSDTVVTLAGSYWNGRNNLADPAIIPGKLSAVVPGYVGKDLGYDTDNNLNFNNTGWDANGSLTVRQDLGNVRLTSISAYRQNDMLTIEDLDFTPFDDETLDNNEFTKTFSQELQISSIGHSRLQWSAGLYYFWMDTGVRPEIIGLDDIGIAISTVDHETVRSPAGYAQATYEVADETHLTLGGRYTDEKREELGTASSVVIPAINETTTTPSPNRSASADKFTYRISLDHRFSSAMMGYASYSTAFKSGGFNVGTPGIAPYEPETLKAGEIGLKSDLLDRHLQLNLAGFYYNYSNLQVQKIIGPSLVIFNGAKSRIDGLDADFTAVLSKGLTLTGGFTWLDSKFTSFPVCPISNPAGGVNANPAGNCTGNEVPFASKFSGSVAINYAMDVHSGTLVGSSNLYANDGFAYEPDNVIQEPRYAKLGSSLKWTARSGVSIGAFVQNLTDRRTRSFAVNAGNATPAVIYDAPRTYGVTVGYKFR